MVSTNLFAWLLVGCIPSMVTATIAITGPSGSGAGINTSTGQRPFRQEINTFKNTGAPFDLYVQAVAKFQAESQTNITGYFQVAGIHGYPATSWDGVNGAGYQPGFCTHGSILFPTWHRPYLALYEQLLWKYAQQIAASYPSSQRSSYEAAAKNFRMPYWDWAQYAQMPDVVTMTSIVINTPTGQKSITNPLYQYAFHPQPSSSQFPHDSTGVWKYTTTVRCPNSAGKTQTSVAQQGLSSNAQSLHDGTYQMLSSQSSYGPFSNTDWPSGSSYQSIESLHNNIHGLVGGNGHMGWVPYSSFDPIFWLHHTNVDRIFAIWQALYPNSFVGSQNDAYGTYTNVPGRSENANTPLTPFHSNTGGTLYTSNTARSTRTFGYTYPEVVDWGVSATQLSANTRAAINRLYNPNGSTKKTRKARRDDADGALAPRTAAPDATAAHRQWALNFRGDKSQIPESLYIHFFLDSPAGTDPTQWPADPEFIATQAILIDPTMKEKMAGSAPVFRGQIPLTHALLDVEPDLDPKKCVKALRKKLEFRAATLGGEAIPASALEGEEKVYLEVVARDVTQTAPEDEFPVYGPWTTYAKGSFQGGTYSLGKSLRWTDPSN